MWWSIITCLKVFLEDERVVIYLVMIRRCLIWIWGRFQEEIFENHAQEDQNGELANDEALCEGRLE